MIIVYYHKNCTDGLGSAWSFRQKYGDKAEYIPFNYGDQISDPTGYHIYFVDCSAKENVLLDIKDKDLSLNVIDHHISAQKKLDHLDFCHFDQEHSGAVLAWKYCFPEKEVPLVLRYIEDRDLWRWKLPYSKQISEVIFFKDFSFETIDYIDSMLREGKDGFEKIVKTGDIILAIKNMQIEKIMKNIIPIKIDGYNGCMINSPIHKSEIGSMSKNYDFCIIYNRIEKNSYICSIRTTKEDVDVSIIAEKFGGGGHRKASGFRVSNINKIFNQ